MNKPKLTAIVVDDEFYAREAIRLLLEREADIELVANCEQGVEAVEQIRALQPDLVFLDIQMPGMDGFEVVQALQGERLPYFIFATAFDRFALKAFEVNAVDYLLKPFSDDRFFEAVARAKSRVRQDTLEHLSRDFLTLVESRVGERTQVQDPLETWPYPERVALKQAGSITFVSVAEIDWIEAADQYVFLHAGTKKHLLRESMSHFEKTLDPARFCRIHRSTIVNLERVQEVQPHFKGDFILLLKDGTQLKGSRSRKANLTQKLGL